MNAFTIHNSLIQGCFGYYKERSIKHLTIAASAGEYHAMQALIVFFDKGVVSRDAINSALTAYNNSCAEMRSDARDACIRDMQLRKFGRRRGGGL